MNTDLRRGQIFDSPFPFSLYLRNETKICVNVKFKEEKREKTYLSCNIVSVIVICYVIAAYNR